MQFEIENSNSVAIWIWDLKYQCQTSKTSSSTEQKWWTVYTSMFDLPLLDAFRKRMEYMQCSKETTRAVQSSSACSVQCSRQKEQTKIDFACFRRARGRQDTDCATRFLKPVEIQRKNVSWKWEAAVLREIVSLESSLYVVQPKRLWVLWTENSKIVRVIEWFSGVLQRERWRK